MAGELSLADIIAQSSQLASSQAGQAQQISNYYSQAQAAQRQQADDIQKAGELKSQAELTKLQGELATQKAALKVANSLGTNVQAESEILTKLNAKYRQNALQYLQAEDAVSELEANNNLLTNPTGFMKDLLIGDDLRGKRDALKERTEAGGQIIQQLNQLTQQGVVTQNAISQTLNDASNAQNAQAIKLQANANAAQARAQSALSGATGIEALQRVGAANFNRLMQMYNAQQQAEMFAFQKAQRDQQLKELGDKAAMEAELVENVNTWETAMGLPKTSPTMIKRYYGTKTEEGQRIQLADLGGFKIKNTGSAAGALGSTPWQSYSNTIKYGVDVPDSYAPSKKILDDTYAEFQELQSQLGQKNKYGQEVPVTFTDYAGNKVVLSAADFKTPEAMEATFNRLAKNKALSYQSSIKEGENNPYKIVPLPNILESGSPEAEAVKNSRFGRIVVPNLVAAGKTQPTVEELMEFSLAALEAEDPAERLTFNEIAAGGNALIKAGVAVNNLVGGYTTFDLPTANSYFVPVDFLVKTPLSTKNTWGGVAGFQIPELSKDQATAKSMKNLNVYDFNNYVLALNIKRAQNHAQKIGAQLAAPRITSVK